MHLPPSVRVLRRGTFVRYLAATAVSTLGSSMSMVALAFAVLEFGDASDLDRCVIFRHPLVVCVGAAALPAIRAVRDDVAVPEGASVAG